jgi:hypothetical protein
MRKHSLEDDDIPPLPRTPTVARDDATKWDLLPSAHPASGALWTRFTVAIPPSPPPYRNQMR